MKTRTLSIRALAISFLTLMLTTTFWVMAANNGHLNVAAQDNETASLAEEVSQAGLTQDDIITLREQIIPKSLAYLRDELGLSSAEHTAEVEKVLIGGNSARADIHLITFGELGKIDEIIHVFVLHEGGTVRSVFREPSPEFHLYADKVSSLLLPSDRLKYWTELRLAEEQSLNESNSLYLLPFDGGTQRYTAQDWNKHIDFAGSDYRVRAARGGAVYVKRAAQDGGGCGSQYVVYDNYVRVTHQDGTYAWYLHQQWNTIPNFPNGTVEQGSCLGLAGKTGWACGAHLHFNVSTTSDNSGEPGEWLVPSFTEGMPADNAWSPLSQNSAASCDQSSDPLTVNPPPISPSAGTCGNGWNQIAGFAGQPAYTTRNAQSSSQSTNSATWIPTIAQAGTYGVEAYIPNHGTAFCNTSVSYDTTNAVYTLTDSNNASFTKSVNQQPLANVWVYLGDLYCNPGQSCRVRLTDITGEQLLSRTVSFSAVRFTLKSSPPPVYSISGSITDGAGAGLGGVSISAGGKTVQTDGNGNYVISDLSAGVYTISPSKAEYTFSPGSQTVTVGPNATGVNFTASLVTYSIRGRVSDSANGSGISGAAVSAGGKTAQTDGEGNYTLSGLGSGSYSVSVSKSGYGFNPPTRNVTLGPDANGVDFTGTAATYSIKGSVTTGAGALAGVTISAGSQTATTDASGNYTIGGLTGGVYTVVPSKAGYSFTPTSRSVTVGPDALGINFVGSVIPVEGARLFVSPATQTVGLTSQVCVQARVEKSPELHAFEFTLGFPPDLLEATNVTLGPFLGSTGRTLVTLPTDINNATGRVKFGAATLGAAPGATGNGDLATVCFTPKKAGTAALDLLVGKLSGPNGAAIPVSLAGGSVTITSCYFADFDCNNEVDILDVQQIAGRWGKRVGDAGYDARYDVVPSGEIDILDIQLVASLWGWPNNRLAPKATQAPTALSFSIDPTQLELAVGETRQIALKVTGAQNLGAFEIKLHYDGALIRVNSVRLTDFLESTGRQTFVLGPEIDNTAGQVRFGAATIGWQPGVTGNGQIALIEVTALAVGDGALDLHDGRASDPAAVPITVSLIDGSYQIAEGTTGDEYSLMMPVILHKP